MALRQFDSGAMLVIFLLLAFSFVPTVVFFTYMQSSAQFGNDQIKLGGAIAAFFILFFAFRQTYFSISKRTLPSDLESREQLHRLIKDYFRLYKAALTAWRQNIGLRVHFLKYLPETNELQMLIQDEDYDDSGFCKEIREGLTERLAVCEAAHNWQQKKPELVALMDLDEDHYLRYKDSKIPHSIKSVIAYPVKYKKSGKLAGVVSMDSELTIEEFKINRERPWATFRKLRTLVEGLIADHEDQIKEI